MQIFILNLLQEDGAAVPSFPELQEQIRDAIEELGGTVFPKLNWSSPRVSHGHQCLFP